MDQIQICQTWLTVKINKKREKSTLPDIVLHITALHAACMRPSNSDQYCERELSNSGQYTDAENSKDINSRNVIIYKQHQQ